MFERLDLENAYYHKDKNIEVLNAPFKTFGDYKRVLFSFRKEGQDTNSYLYTYPNPDNPNEYYVSDLEGNLLQKVIVDQFGKAEIEKFDINFNTNKSGGCTETVYTKCSSGKHSFENATHAECSYWNDLSTGNPPQITTVPVSCDAPSSGAPAGGGDSGATSPTGGSGGGVPTSPTGGEGSEPPTITTEECQVNLDCEDCNLTGDLNNDCSVSFDEGKFYNFLNQLDRNERFFLNNDSELYESVFTYLKLNKHSPESQTFANEALLH